MCVEYLVNGLVSGYSVEGLLKSIVVKSVQKAGFAVLRSSRIVCVICVKRVCVDCLVLNQCWSVE